jgi:hypothetical protein
MSLDHCRILRAADDRWFLVPEGTPIPAGTMAVRNEKGGLELLKAGTLSLWEIPEESAGLILEGRARRLGEKTGEVLNALLEALGVTGGDPQELLASLARAGSPSASEREKLKRRLDATRTKNSSPEIKQALAMLEAELLKS